MSNTPDLDAMPKVMGDDGQFHAVDEEVDLSGTPIEASSKLSKQKLTALKAPKSKLAGRTSAKMWPDCRLCEMQLGLGLKS